jgi:cyclopropane-fatty-acyl-phospholipid synthase
MRQAVAADRPAAASGGFLRRALLSRLRGLRDACVVVEDAAGRETLGDPSAPAARTATIKVHDPRFFRSVALGGHLGAAESYMRGEWDCSDLTALVRALVKNRAQLEGLEKGSTRLLQPLRRFAHWLRRNTRRGSRRNIADHYDLGNDFFELFLDESMTYSCAWFEKPDVTLAEAQAAKHDRICRKLELSAEDHLLEIGTGWGAFAIHAARDYGCRVTTTTISREQRELALQRIRAAGLEEKITVLLEDYRDLEGTFDKLASTEMIEAVGHENYGAFFESCARLLAPGGRLVLQAIVVRDRYYEDARREVDFIKRYIFPGSCIPSVSALLGAVARKADLRIEHLDDQTGHYAETLRRWRANFQRSRAAIAALGYPDRFQRMWEFYLCYCEGGFLERFIGNVQMVFSR